MNAQQREALLRDLLFAARLQDQQRMFQFLAVLPELEGLGVTVHYAYSAADWREGGLNIDPVSFLQHQVAQSQFASDNIGYQVHDVERNGWPHPWELTAKETDDDIPLLVLVEHADSQVTGALLRHLGTAALEVDFANGFCEPCDVEALVRELQRLAVGQRYMSAYKEANVDAASLEQAIAQTAESEAGQKLVLVYRVNEWLSGLWTNPNRLDADDATRGETMLFSVADYHGTYVSEAKLNARAGLEVARTHQTVLGDYAVLEQAMARAAPNLVGDYEQALSLRALCDWWNGTAPQALRKAGILRVYVWDENQKIFIAGDPEEPARLADQLARSPAYALFERAGRSTVAVEFCKGRASNTEQDGYVQIYYVNGERASESSGDLSEVDDAYYAVKGLLTLKHLIGRA